MVALVVLGAWLFALSVAVAYACGLNAELSQAHATAPSALDDQCEGRGDASPPGCVQFCDDNLGALAKIQAVQDPPGGQLVLLAAATDLLPSRDALVAARLARPHRSPGIALHTRFVRLVL